MQFPYDAELAEYLSRPNVSVIPLLEVDWDRDGTWDHPYSDMSGLISKVGVDFASIHGNIPSEVNAVVGTSSAVMTATLSGKDRDRSGLRASQLLSKYYDPSPLSAVRKEGTPIRYTRIVRLASGFRELRQFTGWISEYLIDEDTDLVTLTCSDVYDLQTSRVTLPRWAVGPGPNVNATVNANGDFAPLHPIDAAWVYGEVLMQAGRSIWPQPRGSDTVLHWSMAGSLIPSEGFGSLGNLTLTDWPHMLAYSNGSTGPAPFGADGKYGLGIQPLNQLEDTGNLNQVRASTNQLCTVPDRGSGSGPQYLVLSAWVKSNGSGSFVLSDCSDVSLMLGPYPGGPYGYIQWWISPGGVPRLDLYEPPGTGSSNANVLRTWDWGTNPIPAGWHFVEFGLNMTSSTVTPVMYIDGVAKSPGTSPSNNAAFKYLSNVKQADQTNASILHSYKTPMQHLSIHYGFAGYAQMSDADKNPPYARASNLGSVLNVNPYFETNVSDWTPSAATFVRSTAQFHQGTASGMLTPTGTGTAYTQSGKFAVKGGAKYYFSMWAMCNVSREVTLNVNWFDVNGVYLSTSTAGDTTVSLNVWTRVAGDSAAPPKAAFASLVPTIYGPTLPSQVLWIDEVTAQLRPIAPFRHSIDSNRLTNFPEIYNEYAWDVLRDAVEGELGVMFTREDGQLWMMSRADASLYGQLPIFDDPRFVVLSQWFTANPDLTYDPIDAQTGDKISAIKHNPSADTYRNTVSYTLALAKAIKAVVWSSSDSKQFFAPSGSTSLSKMIGLDDTVISLSGYINAVVATSTPNQPALDYSTMSAIDATNVNNPAAAGWGIGVYWQQNQRSVLILYGAGILSPGPVYIGAIVGGDSPNFQIGGLKIDRSDVQTFTTSDPNEVAARGTVLLDLGQHPWRQDANKASSITAGLVADTVAAVPVIQGLSVPLDPRRQLLDVIKLPPSDIVSGDMYAQVVGKRISDTPEVQRDEVDLRVLVAPSNDLYWDDGNWDEGSWASA